MCSWCMWESLLVYVNFVLWTWQKFVGMCMGKKFDYDRISIYGKILLGM